MLQVQSSSLSICHLFAQHLFCFLLHMRSILHNFYMKGPLGINSSCCRCSPLPLVYAICSYNICFVSYYICAQFTQFSYERDFETTPRNSFFLLQLRSSSLNLCHLLVQHLFCFLLHMRSIYQIFI